MKDFSPFHFNNNKQRINVLVRIRLWKLEKKTLKKYLSLHTSFKFDDRCVYFT